MSGPILLGFGRADVTPHDRFPSGMWMAQSHIRAEGVHRRFYINCAVIGDADQAVAILAYDICILSKPQVAAIKARVGEETGLPPDRIFLHVSHTHAGPVSQDFYDKDGADEVQDYIRELVAQSASAAALAWGDRRPVRAAGGKGSCPTGVNRDLFHEGRIVTGPNPGGFADPELGVLRFDDPDGRPRLAILSFGCHPTYLGPDNKLASPDYPGVMRDVFEGIAGVPCLFLQAGAGNVGPLRGFLGGLEEVEREGTMLGCEAAKVFLGIDTRRRTARLGHVIESGAPLGVVAEDSVPYAAAGFDFIGKPVPLPTDNPGPTVYDTVEDDLAKAEAEVAALSESDPDGLPLQQALQRAVRHKLRLDRKHLYFSGDTMDMQVYALRLDDACLVSVACEAYAELGVAIKAASPYRDTIFAAYEGADVIYVAPRRYYGAPVPMEVFNSPFGPGASDILIGEAVGMLGELRRREQANDVVTA